MVRASAEEWPKRQVKVLCVLYRDLEGGMRGGSIWQVEGCYARRGHIDAAFVEGAHVVGDVLGERGFSATSFPVAKKMSLDVPGRKTSMTSLAAPD